MMRRTAAIACLAASAALLPLQAEAARFRLGGRSHASPAKVNPAKTSRSLVVIPGAAAASGAQAASSAGRPAHVPFPPSSVIPDKPMLRLTNNENAQQPWCRTDIVVGGFCVMN